MYIDGSMKTFNDAGGYKVTERHNNGNVEASPLAAQGHVPCLDALMGYLMHLNGTRPRQKG